MPRRIKLRRTAGWRKPPGAVVCTRSSKLWGNPFRIGDPIPEPWSLLPQYEGRLVEDNAMAVELFDSHVQISPGFKELIRMELAGKDLCCFCGLDEPCHVDVYLRVANEPVPASRYQEGNQP